MISDEEILNMMNVPGATYTSVAKAVGRSRRDVAALCRAAGIDRPAGPPRGSANPTRTFSPAALQSAIDAGTTYCAFARSVGVSRQAVAAAAKRWAATGQIRLNRLPLP
jgi:hypothetical protein